MTMDQNAVATKERPAPETAKQGTMSPAAIRFHYLCVTALVAWAADMTIKSWAVRHLSSSHVTHLGPLALRLVYDKGSTIHPTHETLAYLLETHLLAAAILIGLFFVLKSRLASVGVGLLFAALLGNFVDLAMYPHQVPDFLVIGHVGTANTADVFATVGLLMVAGSLSLLAARRFLTRETKNAVQSSAVS